MRKKSAGEAKVSNVDAGFTNRSVLSLYNVSSDQGLDMSLLK